MNPVESSLHQLNEPKPKETTSSKPSRKGGYSTASKSQSQHSLSREAAAGSNSYSQQKSYYNHSNLYISDHYSNNYVSSVTFVPANHKRGTSLRQYTSELANRQ